MDRRKKRMGDGIKVLRRDGRKRYDEDALVFSSDILNKMRPVINGNVMATLRQAHR
jgi:hypothetical protein